jgi:SAM-dependent methyltransferase
VSLVLVPCAVCGGRDFQLLYRGTLDPTRLPGSYFSSSRQSAAYPDIVRCQACGLVMANPRDDEATLSQVYAELSDGVYEEEDANRARAAEEHLALVLAQSGQRGRLLDVGCATGFFVAAAAGAGFDVSGLDASRFAIERARRRCPEAAFQVGALETARFAPGSFDVITLWDVLEHVHAPRDALLRVCEWLSPAGLLFMSLPNSASLAARVLGPRWVLLLREHLWYFSPGTLGRLLTDTGFDLDRTRVKWVSFSLGNVARRLGQYPGSLGRIMRSLADRGVLKKASVRFPMGEMDVVARRIRG